VKSYVKRVGLALDQFVNAIAGGNEDETISSRVGRGAVAGKWWALVLERVIDAFLGKGHCRSAIGE
jgi:hypothetical protein